MCIHPPQVVVPWCFTVESAVLPYLYFKPRVSRSKHKSSGDIAGTGLHSHFVSWLFRLTLLDLRTNWAYERALGMELVRM